MLAVSPVINPNISIFSNIHIFETESQFSAIRANETIVYRFIFKFILAESIVWGKDRARLLSLNPVNENLTVILILSDSGA